MLGAMRPPRYITPTLVYHRHPTRTRLTTTRIYAIGALLGGLSTAGTIYLYRTNRALLADLFAVTSAVVGGIVGAALILNDEGPTAEAERTQWGPPVTHV